MLKDQVVKLFPVDLNAGDVHVTYLYPIWTMVEILNIYLIQSNQERTKKAEGKKVHSIFMCVILVILTSLRNNFILEGKIKADIFAWIFLKLKWLAIVFL